MNNISFLIGIVAYAVFLLWNQKTNPSKSQNRLLCFIIGLIFSVFMYYVHLIGVTIGGFLGGFLTTFLPLSNTVSYSLSSICGLLLAAFTIKILFSKISDVSFHYFRIVSFFIYLVFGLYMLQQSFSSDVLELQGKSTVMLLLGLSYIGISIYVAMFPFLPKMFSATSKAPSNSVQEETSALIDSVSVDSPKPVENGLSCDNIPTSENIQPVAVADTVLKSSSSSHISIHFSLSKKFVLVIAFIAVLSLGIIVGVLLGEGYFIPSFTPSSPYIDSLKAAESVAYSNGYKNGYTSGQQNGYNSGFDAGKSDGYNNGFIEGLNSGFESGYGYGYSDCYNGYAPLY